MKFLKSIVLRNFIYLFVNQFFNLIVPLLVFPFLIKTLGTGLYGLYSIAYAGVLYCYMFSDYGFNFSGSKYIAVNNSDRDKKNEAFSVILFIKLAFALIVSVAWIIYILLDGRFDDLTLFGLLFLGMIVGNSLSVQWFFQGLEQLGLFSTINTLIKLLANIAVLVFIKGPGDIYLIPLIYSLGALLTGISTILIAIYKVKIKLISFSLNRVVEFLKQGKDYFITIGTTSLVFNGTLFILGFFEHNAILLGMFAILDRIVKILVSVYIPYSTAIYPRIMANFAEGEKKGIKSVFKYGAIAIFFALVCVVLIIIFSKDILNYLDPKIIQYYVWMQLYSSWLFFIIINNLIGYHFLNGLNKSASFRNANLLYTVVTLVAMLTGSYFYSFKGCITAVLAGELFLTVCLVYKIYSCKHDIFKGYAT